MADSLNWRGSPQLTGGNCQRSFLLTFHELDCQTSRLPTTQRKRRESGRLVQVLPGYRTPDADIYAVYPQRQQLSARIRTFVEFLAGSFERFK